MIPWVVIDRRHRRQPRKSRALPRLLLFNVPTCKPSNIPTFAFPYTLPSSVSRNSFICHSYENCRGVYQQFPFWNPSQGMEVVPLLDLRTFRHSNVSPCFRPIPFLFKFFRSLLHLRKTQPFSFQAIPNSFQKTTGGGGDGFTSRNCPAGSILWVAL
jgi:hypothetical protein